MRSSKTKPKNVNEVLASATSEQRRALQTLRRNIHAAAPKAEECISYGLAAFRQSGMLVAFGARPQHCSFFLMNATTVEAHAAELAGYDTSKGTIRFPADRPLPSALVRKLVRERLAENEAHAAARAQRKRR